MDSGPLSIWRKPKVEAELIQQTLEQRTGLPSVEMELPDDLTPDAIAAMGGALSAQYMMGNGPTMTNKEGVQVMTQAQLKEQKMNEAQGYPSNLDEAARVKALESQVAQMSAGIGAILQRLESGGTQPASNPIPQNQKPQPSPSPSFQGQPAVGTQQQAVSAKPSGSRRVLADGRVIEPLKRPAPMGLGVTPGGFVEEPALATTADEDLWTEEASVEQAVVEVDQRAAYVAKMVTETVAWMRSHDPLTFYRRALERAVDCRHLNYHAWNPEFRNRFDAQFASFLGDSIFITKIVETCLNTENGHGLSAKKIAGMVVLSAGQTAFCLAGM